MMTPEQIAAEYLRREREASALPEGQDPQAIIHDLACETGMDPAEVKEIVLDASILGAC